jgi:phage shock protein C
MARRTKYYLDKRNGKIMGVCSGAADYFGISALLIRVLLVLVTVFGAGPFTVIAYIVLGLVADDKPSDFYSQSREEQDFWREVRLSPTTVVRDVRGRFRDLDRRLRDIETYTTSSNRRLSDQIDRLR